MKKALLIGNIIAGVFAANVWAGDTIGSVDTGFKLFGKNNKIEVSAFDDPKVKGVTCYISRPIQGGITGGLGLSEERSDTGIACRAVGNEKPVITASFKNGESVFQESRNILFKELNVTRFYDAQRKVIIYITATRGLVDGSPKHSITAVPL